MGTRNLTVVVCGGTHKVAQYCQWDGYPDGQGVIALGFCREHLATAEGREAFKGKLALVRWIDEAEHLALWKSVGADDSGRVTLDVSEKFERKWPHLHRNCGAAVLDRIATNTETGLPLRDERAFAGDSLFCEWAYVVDLDTNVLEVYKGFNKEALPPGARFADCFQHVERRGEDQYHPIKLLMSFPLDSLPDDESFKASCKDEDDEDEEEALPAPETACPKAKPTKALPRAASSTDKPASGKPTGNKPTGNKPTGKRARKSGARLSN
jgi:hypothetical protein